MVWSESDIKQYERGRRKELGPVYLIAGIGIKEPERRAEYLAKQLSLTQTDHDLLMGIASKEGRAIALRMLEDMAVQFFF